MSTWLLVLKHHDERILHALVVRRRRYTDLFMTAITHLGGASATVGIALVLIVASLPGPADVARVTGFALVASHLGVQVLKRSVVRPRPRLPLGYDALIWAPDRFSFPSGHAAASLSVGLPIALTLPGALGALMIGLSLLVGISRCYLGVHYPGDVLAGWALALMGVIGASLLV